MKSQDSYNAPINHSAVGGYKNTIFLGEFNIKFELHLVAESPSQMDTGHIALGAIHNSREQFSSRSLDPDARAEIPEEVEAWIKDSSNQHCVLWLSGNGRRRWAVMHSIAESLYSPDGNVAATFFFRRRNVKGEHLFLTLAHQLAFNVPGLRSEINAVMRERPEIVSKNIRLQVKTLLLEPFAKLSQQESSPWIVLINGLDECPDRRYRREILALVGEIVSSPHLPLRFLIASSPEEHVIAAFNSEPLMPQTLRVTLTDRHWRPRQSLHLPSVRELLQNLRKRVNSTLDKAWDLYYERNPWVNKSEGRAVKYYDRYVSSGNPPDLAKAISVFESVLTAESPKGEKAATSVYVGYVTALWKQYERDTGNLEILNKVIRTDEDALSAWKNSTEERHHEDYLFLVLNLASAYFNDYMTSTQDRRQAKRSLSQSIYKARDLLLELKTLRGLDRKAEAEGLLLLGKVSIIISQLDQGPNLTEIISDAIYSTQAALSLIDPAAADEEFVDFKRQSFYTLASAYMILYKQVRDTSALNPAIEYYSSAAELFPKDHEDRGACLCNLALGYWFRYEFAIRHFTTKELEEHATSDLSSEITDLKAADRFAKEALPGLGTDLNGEAIAEVFKAIKMHLDLLKC